METPNYFVMFIGYGRSGHSIIGSFIDAHKNAIIAHQYHIAKHRKKSKEELFKELISNSESYAKKKKGGYNYFIENLWNGRYKNLLVLGDKRGQGTSRETKGRFRIFRKIQKKVECPMKIFHIQRNPFDILATQTTKNFTGSAEQREKRLSKKIKRFTRLCKYNNKLKKKFIKNSHFDYIEFKHEDFVSNPRQYLIRICKFLELTPFDDYLEECTKIVRNEPHITRNKVKWSADAKESIEKTIDKYSFLEGYKFQE